MIGLVCIGLPSKTGHRKPRYRRVARGRLKAWTGGLRAVQTGSGEAQTVLKAEIGAEGSWPDPRPGRFAARASSPPLTVACALADAARSVVLDSPLLQVLDFMRSRHT